MDPLWVWKVEKKHPKPAFVSTNEMGDERCILYLDLFKGIGYFLPWYLSTCVHHDLGNICLLFFTHLELVKITFKSKKTRKHRMMVVSTFCIVVFVRGEIFRSTTSTHNKIMWCTLLHEKINPKNWQVLSLGDTGFLQLFRVVFYVIMAKTVTWFVLLHSSIGKCWQSCLQFVRKMWSFCFSFGTAMLNHHGLTQKDSFLQRMLCCRQIPRGWWSLVITD